MTKSPKVAVLMGSYNPRWDRLRRAVLSLQKQTLQDWELVLWDDGSHPQGALALEQAAALDSRVHLYRGRENRGLAYALNRCLERSHSPYLARLDDDDACHPRRLEAQVSFLESHPQYGWVGSTARLVDRNGIWDTFPAPEVPGPRDFLAHSPYIHPTVMFRRQVLEEAGGYHQSARYVGCEDYELFFRLHRKGLAGCLPTGRTGIPTAAGTFPAACGRLPCGWTGFPGWESPSLCLFWEACGPWQPPWCRGTCSTG